jgi:hypothetical protein
VQCRWNFECLKFLKKKKKNFVLTFLLLDPDPDSGFGSGAKDLLESGSNPDPKHCLPYLLCIRYHYESTPLVLNATYIAAYIMTTLKELYDESL